MRFVFDTNVVVSGLMLLGSAPRRAFDLAREHGRLLVSEATHIISGDQDLLMLSPFRGVAILTPVDFVREQFE